MLELNPVHGGAHAALGHVPDGSWLAWPLPEDAYELPARPAHMHRAM